RTATVVLDSSQRRGRARPRRAAGKSAAVPRRGRRSGFQQRDRAFPQPPARANRADLHLLPPVPVARAWRGSGPSGHFLPPPPPRGGGGGRAPALLDGRAPKREEPGGKRGPPWSGGAR